jgi:2-desacetyl-2-hydroxyethyl bacteriochlorophyllide A dehydrogenase
MMRALVWHAPREMTVDNVPEPQPDPGEVVVRSDAAGICGSEVEGYLGLMPNRIPPLVMGHEFAGTVTAVGDAVDPKWTGKRVAVNPIIGCGHCEYCVSGRRNLCPDRKLIGVASPGGFGEYVAVPERCLFAMPSEMDARAGALVEPLANGIHAIRKAWTDEATTAVIIGAGTIGLACMQAALLRNPARVSVIELHPKRREHAMRLGAHEAFADASALQHRADVVIDAAGTQQTRALSVDLLSAGGTAIFIGMHVDESALPWRKVIRGNHAIRGVFAYEDVDFQRALDLLAAGHAGIGELKPLLSLDSGPAAFAELASGPTGDLKVFLGG